MTPVLPVDTHEHEGTYDEHVCVLLAHDPVEQPLPRPAHRRLASQLDRQLVDAVKISTVLIDVIPGLVDNPVPTGLTSDQKPLVWQMRSDEDLSVDEKDVDGLGMPKSCSSEDRPLCP